MSAARQNTATSPVPQFPLSPLPQVPLLPQSVPVMPPSSLNSVPLPQNNVFFATAAASATISPHFTATNSATATIRAAAVISLKTSHPSSDLQPSPPSTTRPVPHASLLSGRSLLAVLLLAYGLVAGLFAVFTPPWQAPDEPAHYNYVAQVARSGCCPVIEPGDWDSRYLDQLKAAHFAPDLLANLPRIQYEDHQPPLYYLLQSLVFKLTGGSLTALRLFSVLLGGGIVFCAYQVGLLLLPDRPQVALGAAALVAFLPQHVAILASVNNDALGNLVIALALWLTALYLKGERVQSWHLGLLVGVGLLTKVSTLFLVALVPLAMLLKWWPRSEGVTQGRRYPPSQFIHQVLVFAIPVLLLGGLWWARSISVYGFPDVFGLRQHDRVVTDQPRTADLIAQIGWGTYLNSAFQTTFNSFWGQFGWMALPMPEWVYRLIQALLLLCVSGLGLQWVRRSGPPEPAQRSLWIVLVVTLILAVLAYVYYNTVFLQLQGRYMFTGLIPFALILAWSVDAWLAVVAGRVDESSQLRALIVYLTLLPFALFALLDVYLLWRVIIPGLKP